MRLFRAHLYSQLWIVFADAAGKDDSVQPTQHGGIGADVFFDAVTENVHCQLRSFVAFGHQLARMERRLSVDLESARLAVLEIRASLEPERLSLKDMEVEVEIIKNLLKENAAEGYELQKAQATRDVLKETVSQKQKLLAQAQKDYEATQLRKDEFEQRLPVRPQSSDKELAPIRQAILVQERRIEELIKQRDIIVLTAPFDGVVNTLFYKPGQTVVRGDLIMTIIKPIPEFITAWVPQKNLERFELNTKVQVASLTSPYQTFESQVSHMSSSMELMPEQLWKSPTLPEWGRSIQIPIQPSFNCLHNEVVNIKTIRQPIPRKVI